MRSIYGITKFELETYFKEMGQSAFRASQVFEWLYDKRVSSFDEMTNLNKDLIAKLKEDFSFDTIKIIKKEEDKEVVKYLLELSSCEKVEAVLMFHDYGNSLCLSTQVGCNMHCAFCESGRLGKIRNLEVDEMVYPILLIEKDLNVRISHIVLMGIGEPFDNYDNVIKFAKVVNDPKGIQIGARHITVSTCGIVPKIKALSEEDMQINLAISLHAPNNKIRDEIMPINKVYKIEALMESIKEYIKKTNRRVTFEYVMLDGINDSLENAQELANLIRGMNAYVNVIPYNQTSHIGLKASSKEKIIAFYDVLKKNKIGVTIRREFGDKISGACGQLRASS